jgi:hypothetical protein
MLKPDAGRVYFLRIVGLLLMLVVVLFILFCYAFLAAERGVYYVYCCLDYFEDSLYIRFTLRFLWLLMFGFNLAIKLYYSFKISELFVITFLLLF